MEEGCRLAGALLYCVGDTLQAAEETAEGMFEIRAKIKREVGFPTLQITLGPGWQFEWRAEVEKTKSEL